MINVCEKREANSVDVKYVRELPDGRNLNSRCVGAIEPS